MEKELTLRDYKIKIVYKNNCATVCVFLYKKQSIKVSQLDQIVEYLIHEGYFDKCKEIIYKVYDDELNELFVDSNNDEYI